MKQVTYKYTVIQYKIIYLIHCHPILAKVTKPNYLVGFASPPPPPKHASRLYYGNKSIIHPPCMHPSVPLSFHPSLLTFHSRLQVFVELSVFPHSLLRDFGRVGETHQHNAHVIPTPLRKEEQETRASQGLGISVFSTRLKTPGVLSRDPLGSYLMNPFLASFQEILLSDILLFILLWKKKV